MFKKLHVCIGIQRHVSKSKFVITRGLVHFFTEWEFSCTYTRFLKIVRHANKTDPINFMKNGYKLRINMERKRVLSGQRD